MARLLNAAAILILTTGIATAATAAHVPASARKLTGAEIVRLYDNTWFRFHNYMKPVTTGTFLVNFAARTASGTYKTGKRRGNWRGTVRIRGDKFCRTIGKQRETCVFLYVDGGDVYEVNSRGRIESKNKRN